MSASELLHDIEAERCVAGASIASVRIAAQAGIRITGEHFYDLTLGRMFTAAVDLDELHGVTARIAAVATACELPFGFVAEITDESIVDRVAIAQCDLLRAFHERRHRLEVRTEAPALGAFMLERAMRLDVDRVA